MDNYLHITMICDRNFVIPTAVCIQSVIQNRAKTTRLHFHIIAENILESQKVFLEKFNDGDSIKLDIIPVSESSIAQYHHDTPNTFRAASLAALYKFSLPELLPDLSKVLYLDGDILVKGDILDLYDQNIDGHYAAVIMDSGVIYSNAENVKRFPRYFNSGVMLLNLEELRKNNASEELIHTKMAETSSTLVDQNVLNIVFEGHVVYMPLTFNFLYTNLIRAAERYGEELLAEKIRKSYNVPYKTIREIFDNARIVHFSSRDKPWKDYMNLYHDEWFDYYQTLIDNGFFRNISQQAKPQSDIRYSIILTVFNEGASISDWLNNMIDVFSREDSEIICVLDGATDANPHMIAEIISAFPNFKVFFKTHIGKTEAERFAISQAQGRYIYMPEINADFDREILCLHSDGRIDEADISVYQNITSFPESDEFEKTENDSIYSGVYARKAILPVLKTGKLNFLDPSGHFYSRSFLLKTGLLAEAGGTSENSMLYIKSLLKANTIGLFAEEKLIEVLDEGRKLSGKKQMYDFVSYYRTLVYLIKTSAKEQKNAEDPAFMRELISFMAQMSAAKYSQLNSTEKSLEIFDDEDDNTISIGLAPLFEYQNVIKNISNQMVSKTQKAQKDLAAQMQREIDSVYRSKSYRIGNSIIDPVKKASEKMKKILH